MITGRTLTKNIVEKHLDSDEWLEVFPNGKSPREMAVVASLAAKDRKYRKEIQYQGQSPLLVRKTAWEQVKVLA